MLRKRNKIENRRYGAFIAGTVGAGLLLSTIGCGRTETQDAALRAVDPGDAAPVRAAPSDAAVIPAPDIPDDAPELAEVYPALSSGVLRLARLTDGLPAGILLQAEGLAVTRADLEAELDRIPPAMHDQMRQNAFFLLEQKATGDLLLARARKTLDATSLSDELLVQRYFEQLVGGVSVSDAEIDIFYEENRELVGGAPLDQVRPSIQQHLVQEKQQIMVESHIRELGRESPIAVAAAWVETQAALALDNPLDRARASGTPTFASFGADSCMPCQMMKPIREAIREKYDGRLNVVYVHADRDQVLASRYGIRGIPHMIFFNADGGEIHQQTGMMTEEQIEAILLRCGVTL